MCNWGDHTVRVLSSDGSQLLLTIRESANALPRNAVCHQKMIFVSYYLAGIVKVFSEKDGVFLYSIGVSKLSYPLGLLKLTGLITWWYVIVITLDFRYLLLTENF